MEGDSPETDESGLPFTDPSGVRLRDWMGVDEATFYGDARLGVAAQAHGMVVQVVSDGIDYAIRHVLERQLDLNDNTHYQELLDAQQAQARLRDRLATADLRLSVLLDRDATPDLPAAPGAGSLDHGAPRARLDPAHARRIIAITDAGDAGLIALRACQGYIRALTP